MTREEFLAGREKLLSDLPEEFRDFVRELAGEICNCDSDGKENREDELCWVDDLSDSLMICIEGYAERLCEACGPHCKDYL